MMLMGNDDDARCVFPLTNLQIGYGVVPFDLIPFGENNPLHYQNDGLRVGFVDMLDLYVSDWL